MGLVIIDQEEVPVLKRVSVTLEIAGDWDGTYFAERVLFGSFFLVGAMPVVAAVAVEPAGPPRVRSLAVTVVGIPDTWRSELQIKGQWRE